MLELASLQNTVLSFLQNQLGFLPEPLLLGILTPLTAACVLPLYPGFISHLANQVGEEAERRTYALFGVLVVAGVISFMFVMGLVFTTFLRVSSQRVVGIVSPIAFVILAIISIFLLLDRDLGSILGSVNAPQFENPLANAYSYGFFFGAIVIPCNPTFIAGFFATSLLVQSPATNMFNFLQFGLGMGLPLLAFSVLSAKWSKKIVGTLTDHKTLINRGSGLIMLTISLYYLIFNFQVIPL